MKKKGKKPIAKRGKRPVKKIVKKSKPAKASRKPVKKPRKKPVRRPDVNSKIDASPLGIHKQDGLKFHPLKLLHHHINQLAVADREMTSLSGPHCDHVRQRIEATVIAMAGIANDIRDLIKKGEYAPLADPS